MRGRDEESGEFRGPSRSQERREALGVLELAKVLVALTPAQTSRVPVPDWLLPHIEETRRITSNVAHKRQLAFLAKQMRRMSDEETQAIRDALDEKSAASRTEVAALHRVEATRQKLLDGGDEALGAFVGEHPDADRQRLRQLVRNTHEERRKNKPPHSFRELFRELRGVMLPDADVHDDDDPIALDEASDSGDELR